MVQAILDGRQPDGLELPALLKPFPLEWELQRARLVTTPWGQTAASAVATKAVKNSQRAGA
jgi:hypothetical protein